MKRRSFRANCSGQVLIVSALLVALILLSTAIYVIEIGKNVPEVQEVEGDSFAGYAENFRSALISALANVSNGGDATVLSVDLQTLKAVILAHSYRAMLNIEYNLQDSAPYADGFLFSGDANGQGISSACASFMFAASGLSGSSELEFTVNVTSTIDYDGTYFELTGNTKQVNLTVNILNEGSTALAQNFTVYVDYDGSLSTVDWVQVTSPTTVNFGNGTYALSFIGDTGQRGGPVIVSLLCHDKRGILIGANATCTLAG